MSTEISRTSWVDIAVHTMRLWWWVIAIAIAAVAIYERGFILLQQEKLVLSTRLSYLEDRKREALQKQRLLREEFASHEDPAWVELVLRRSLGLTPSGYQKVYFIR